MFLDSGLADKVGAPEWPHSCVFPHPFKAAFGHLSAASSPIAAVGRAERLAALRPAAPEQAQGPCLARLLIAASVRVTTMSTPILLGQFWSKT
jgi:hypothetical protein